MHVLIDMKTYRVISANEDEALVDAAKTIAAPPTNVFAVGGDWAGFSGVDLVKLYNTFPGVTPVKRFETRAIGVQRVNAVLAATPLPAYADEPAPNVPDAPVAEPQENDMSKKTTKQKTPRKVHKTNGDDTTVRLTAAGKSDSVKFNNGSARGKVFNAIQAAKGEIGLSDLVKRCSHFAKRGQVLGCVQKLVAKKYVTLD